MMWQRMIAMAAAGFAGCGTPITADVTIEATEELSSEMAYPLLMQTSVVRGSGADSVLETHRTVLCEPLAEPWILTETLQTQAAGQCEDQADLQVRVEMSEAILWDDGPCHQVDRVEPGAPYARGTAPLWTSDDPCGQGDSQVHLVLELGPGR